MNSPGITSRSSHDAADRPHVVFIHGMWCTSVVWQQWVEAFRERGFSCSEINLPGRDRSRGIPVEQYGLDDYVDAVVSDIQHLRNPVLVGHSLGGLVAQLVAQRTALGGIVLLNSAVPGHIFPIRLGMVPGLLRQFLRWRFWEKPFRMSTWEMNYLVFNKMPASGRRELWENLVSESGRVITEVGFGPLNWRKSNRVRREQVRCPILCHAGMRDRIIPRSLSRKMARWYGAQLEYREWPDNAHWLIGEPEWRQVVDETLGWADQLVLDCTHGESHGTNVN